MTINKILEKLKNLQRVDIWMGSEEGYDDYWYSLEGQWGDFVRFEDIDRLIKEIEGASNKTEIESWAAYTIEKEKRKEKESITEYFIKEIKVDKN